MASSASSRAAVGLKSSGSVGPNAQTRQVPYSEYVANTEGNPEAEVKRIAADIKERIAGHEKRTDEDRSQQINELKGELSAMREAYKKGGAKAALDLYEVDPLGLDRLDRAVLEALCVRFGGGPVGLSTLAISVGEETETVEEVAEPFLVRQGFLMRTPRGRVATARGWAHLGLTMPASAEPDLFGG